MLKLASEPSDELLLIVGLYIRTCLIKLCEASLKLCRFYIFVFSVDSIFRNYNRIYSFDSISSTFCFSEVKLPLGYQEVNYMEYHQCRTIWILDHRFQPNERIIL